MKRNISIRMRYRIFMIAAVTITILITGALMGREMWRIVDGVARDYARLYNNEIASEMEAHLLPEIALSLKAADTDIVKAWMKDPQNEALKRNAFSELMHYNDALADQNIFIVLESTRQIYFINGDTRYETFLPTGTLSPDMEEDVWYFKTIEYDKPFLLNIDIDRFLNTMRVWINAKVQDEKETLGVMGTGLYLKPFKSQIFEGRGGGEAETIVINGFGSVQIDTNLDGISQNSILPETDISKTVFRYCNEADFTGKVKEYLNKPGGTTILQLGHDRYRYAALTPIHGTEWHAVTFFSTQALYDFRNLIPVAAVMLVTLIAMAVLVSAVVRRTFVRPFEMLTESIRLKEGTQDVELYGLDRDDEFGIIANSIQELTERLVKMVPVGVFRMSASGSVHYGNYCFLEQFACHGIDDFRKMAAESPSGPFRYKRDRNRFMQSVHGGSETITYEAEFIDVLQRNFWAEVRCNKVLQEDGSYEYQCILINVQDIKEHEKALMSMAVTDRLTGVFNRHQLDQVVLEELNRSERYGGPLSLIIADLDHFKRVNDTYGHDVGDDVLVDTAHQLQGSIRQSDTLARWGGEEFAILLPGSTLSGARVLAEHLREVLEGYEHPAVGRVTASFGVAERQEGESYENWFKRADKALYKAKHQGRNRVVVNAEGHRPTHGLVQLTWQDAFVSGNGVIDGQHRQLFIMGNQLVEKTIQRADHMVSIEDIDQIASHLATHFKEEMEIVEQSGFPQEDIARHESEHRRLLGRVAEIKTLLINGKAGVMDVLNLLVQEVILGHMVVEDVKFFPYVSRE